MWDVPTWASCAHLWVVCVRCVWARVWVCVRLACVFRDGSRGIRVSMRVSGRTSERVSDECVRESEHMCVCIKGVVVCVLCLWAYVSPRSTPPPSLGGPHPPIISTRNQDSHRARLGGRTWAPDPSTVAGAVTSLL